jgi:hypothetical protein
MAGCRVVQLIVNQSWMVLRVPELRHASSLARRVELQPKERVINMLWPMTCDLQSAIGAGILGIPRDFLRRGRSAIQPDSLLNKFVGWTYGGGLHVKEEERQRQLAK